MQVTRREFLLQTGHACAGYALGAAALVVNAIAYPVLGCLDVMLLLESRMRTEGLDITLRRTLTRSVATEATLQAPR